MMNNSPIIDPFEIELSADLSNPEFFASDIEIASEENSLKYYRDIFLIRKTEELIAEWVDKKVALTPCHLSIGQEAVAVGVSANLRTADRIFSTHRSHAHFLATGAPLKLLLAEVLGKETGCSKGRGGSQHLIAKEYGFWGSVPIVAGTIPIAVGAALAAKMDGGASIGVTYFGDGASEEGVFHESLNMASNLKIPALFVCENNLFSSHLDLKLRQPSCLISRFANANAIKSLLVDGNNVEAVVTASATLVNYIRETGNPAFLEAITYRHRGHVGHREDIDVGILRSQSDLEKWKLRDPLLRLEHALIKISEKNAPKLEHIKNEVIKLIAEGAEFAGQSKFPPGSDLLEHVYAQ